jgi:hypothetical protein
MCQALVANAVDQVEIDPGVRQRATKADNQGHLLGGKRVAVSCERGLQISLSFIPELRIRHGLLGEPLQDIDSHRAVVR